MKRSSLNLVIVVFALIGCSRGVSTPAPEITDIPLPPPTETAIPTATKLPTSTATPTVTPTATDGPSPTPTATPDLADYTLTTYDLSDDFVLFGKTTTPIHYFETVAGFGDEPFPVSAFKSHGKSDPLTFVYSVIFDISSSERLQDVINALARDPIELGTELIPSTGIALAEGVPDDLEALGQFRIGEQSTGFTYTSQARGVTFTTDVVIFRRGEIAIMVITMNSSSGTGRTRIIDLCRILDGRAHNLQR